LWLIDAVGPRRWDGAWRHQVLQLSLREVHQRRYLVIVDLEGHGDHSIVEAVVSEPDRHCVEWRQLPDR